MVWSTAEHSIMFVLVRGSRQARRSVGMLQLDNACAVLCSGLSLMTEPRNPFGPGVRLLDYQQM